MSGRGAHLCACSGKYIALPEDLMEHIDAATSKNPQYQAKPVQWLHCLWDFWEWADKGMQMGNPAQNLFKSQAVDENGWYRGMYDLIFTAHAEQLALLQYREAHDFPLRPEGSPGIQVIKHLPEAPPKLAKVEPFEKWGRCARRAGRRGAPPHPNPR